MAKASDSIKIGALKREINPMLALYNANANLLETDFQPDAFFVPQHSHNGTTLRYGWTFAGKNTASSAVNHSHAE
jgi:hypothetical protein